MADRFESIAVGEEAELEHVVAAEDIDQFARLTGDTNPVHMDDAFAARSGMQKRVAHGMLAASFISTVIGTRLPGKGALWFEQNLRFTSPVRIGERIRVVAKVIRKFNAERVLEIQTTVFGDGSRTLIEGEAKVKVLRDPEAREVAPTTRRDGSVIVTGASRGIGAAIAKALAGDGFPVVVNFARSATEAADVVEAIRDSGGQATAIRADMAEPGAAGLLVEEAVGRFGRLSGIVNNCAPPMILADFGTYDWDVVEHHVIVQVRSAFALAQAALEQLIDNNGSIVSVASIAGVGQPPPRNLAYVVAKSALLALSRALAVELGPKGVRVNAVAPGMIDTAYIAGIPEKAQLIAKQQTPLRRLGDPEDVAGVVRFLFSDAARHIAGETLHVSGGASMP